MQQEAINNNITINNNIPTRLETIYFIGIGGIGMSAIARYFHAQGKIVSGYDKTPTALTQALEAEGVAIHYTEDFNQIPKNPDVVVYTPAVPATHQELIYYQNKGIAVVKRSDILQWITFNSFNICVAGTHGKTTTTTMIAHILRHSGYGCNAFLGGIAANYGTNFWSHPNNVVVVEADEYDRSFLKLSPDVAIITSMDADHLDIYGTETAVQDAFVAFQTKIKPNGKLIYKYGLKRAAEFSITNKASYSIIDIQATIHIDNLMVEGGAYRFNVVHPDWTIENVLLKMGGLHNIENAIAAIGVAKYLKIEDNKIKAALTDFKGVKRRFEYILQPTDTSNWRGTFIDDYAHHPAELDALISGVRSIFPQQKITIVFQPHLYSRTKDLYKEFAESLDKADAVILLPIYPARELPIEGVTSALILENMQIEDKKLLTKEALMTLLATEAPPLLVFAGAGDIDALVVPVQQLLMKY